MIQQLCHHGITIELCTACRKSGDYYFTTSYSSEPLAKKNDLDKPMIHLVPSEYIEATALAFNYGATKYGANNYRNGLAWSRCLNACFRHLLAFNRGESVDPESGLPHLAHASASLGMLFYMVLNHEDLNDIHELGGTYGTKGPEGYSTAQTSTKTSEHYPKQCSLCKTSKSPAFTEAGTAVCPTCKWPR